MEKRSDPGKRMANGANPTFATRANSRRRMSSVVLGGRKVTSVSMRVAKARCPTKLSVYSPPPDAVPMRVISKWTSASSRSCVHSAKGRSAIKKFRSQGAFWQSRNTRSRVSATGAAAPVSARVAGGRTPLWAGRTTGNSVRARNNARDRVSTTQHTRVPRLLANPPRTIPCRYNDGAPPLQCIDFLNVYT